MGAAGSMPETHGGPAMSATELIALLLAAGLLAYLTVALLKPEWFA